MEGLSSSICSVSTRPNLISFVWKTVIYLHLIPPYESGILQSVILITTGRLIYDDVLKYFVLFYSAVSIPIIFFHSHDQRVRNLIWDLFVKMYV